MSLREVDEIDCNPPENVAKLLSEEEKAYFTNKKKTYLQAYPFLKEPAMEFLLNELLYMEVRLAQLNAKVLSGVATQKDEAEHSALRRTYVLYLTRMGISYISRERRKEKMTKKSPLEKLTEE